MKCKILSLILALLMLLVGCADQRINLYCLQPSITMIEYVSLGRLERALQSVDRDCAEPGLEEHFQQWAAWFDNRPIYHTQCIYYDVTGDRAAGDDYFENLRFEIELEDGTICYAQVWYHSIEGTTGITNLEFYEKAPW